MSRAQLSFILLCLLGLGKQKRTSSPATPRTAATARPLPALCSLSLSLLPPPLPALSAASHPCLLRFYMRGRQRKRAVFTAEEMDTAIGHRLTCACNETEERYPISWEDSNGRVLPKVTSGAIVDYKVARRNKGKAAHLRIKRGFSCAEAGEYTCVVGDTRRSVFVTPRGG